MNFDYMDNGGEKSFSCKSKASLSCIIMERTWYNKKNGDYNKYPSLSHSRMNFDYKKNYGKKSFSCKIQSINIMYPNVETMVLGPITIKNGDYYEYPSFSYFMDERWL